VSMSPKRPFTEYLSPEARQRLVRCRDEVLKEHWGPDRFESYCARFTPPAWLAQIPQLPERDENGRLPGLS
jgi:hypothetical protein